MATPLGEFIRMRRNSLRPETVGLQATGRRRTPGLRRSELAALAGISVEYLTRIEQGQDRNPSIDVLGALSSALQLTVSEDMHIRHLAKVTGGVGLGSCPAPRDDVRMQVMALLQQFEPGAALVTNRLGDVLAHTATFGLMAEPVGLLEGEEPNLTRFVFTDDRARDVFPDWDDVADELVFDLGLSPCTERVTRFREELAAVAGEAFTARSCQLTVPQRGTQRWNHPLVGELRFEREILELPPQDAQQLVAFLPADDGTDLALDRLRQLSSIPTG